MVELKSDCYILDGVVCKGMHQRGTLVLLPRDLPVVA